MLQGINLPKRHTVVRQAVIPSFCPIINATKQGMPNKLFQTSTQTLFRLHETVRVYESSYLAVVERAIEQAVIFYLVFTPSILQVQGFLRQQDTGTLARFPFQHVQVNLLDFRPSDGFRRGDVEGLAFCFFPTDKGSHGTCHVQAVR